MKKITIKNIVWKEGKYYVAQCLNIDVASFGRTKVEALSNLQEALELRLEDAKQADISFIERPEIVSRLLAYA